MRTEADDVVMVELVIHTFDREWWRTYATFLARRFRTSQQQTRTR
jgi:hypothetical protein